MYKMPIRNNVYKGFVDRVHLKIYTKFTYPGIIQDRSVTNPHMKKMEYGCIEGQTGLFARLYTNLEHFRTDIKYVFGFLQREHSKEELVDYVSGDKGDD